MADGFAELNSGTGGPKVKGDTDGSSHFWQYIKLAFGLSGTQTHVADQDGNRLPVAVRDGLKAASVVAGQATVTTAEASLPTATARRFRLRALIGNTGVIYLGPTGVTAGTGYPLEPGDVTPPLEVSNLNVVKAIASAAGQVLAYLGEV